jgi:Protein of unknown function (DUF4230)
MDNTKGWALVIGFLLIVGIAAFSIVYVVRNTIQQSVSPVESMTGDLGTRVAQALNPTPTVIPDPVTIIRDVRSLARLETIQYTVEKVITAETGQGTFRQLFGDKLIFIARGIVVAGIDLSKMGPDDLKIENGILYARLPEAEIFIASLDNDKSYVYNRDTGLLTKGDINLETTARQSAEDEIEKAALEDGILNIARINAENYMYRLFRQLGYPEVIFVGGGIVTTPTP